MKRIVLSAAAKINLFLRVLGEEVDGYHYVESLYQSVDVRDTLEIKRGGDGITLELSGLEIPDGEANLAFRAAKHYLEAAGLDEPLHIRLEKNIPVGAGLGGGSADAAAVLSGLNVLFDEKLKEAELLELAGTIGSDVPFVLKGGTAIGWSRGDRLITLSPLPAWPVVVCVPDFQVDTGSAYHALDDDRDRVRAAAMRLFPADFYSLDTLRSLAVNDFEPVIMKQHPVLTEIRDTFLQLGATIALLSGTGSAVFALFSSERERAGCVRTMSEMSDYRMISSRLSMEGVQVEDLE